MGGKYGLRARDGRNIVIVIIVLGVLAIAAVILRVVSRRIRKVSLGLDDYLMLTAIVSATQTEQNPVFLIVFSSGLSLCQRFLSLRVRIKMSRLQRGLLTSVLVAVTHGGVGLHMTEVDPEDLIYTMKVCIAATSTGVGLTYLRPDDYCPPVIIWCGVGHRQNIADGFILPALRDGEKLSNRHLPHRGHCLGVGLQYRP